VGYAPVLPRAFQLFRKGPSSLPEQEINDTILKGQCQEMFDFRFFYMDQFSPHPWLYH
jgi:hypothetical protein